MAQATTRPSNAMVGREAQHRRDQCKCDVTLAAVPRTHYGQEIESARQNISMPSSSRLAEQTVIPFLAEHIPSQYSALGNATKPDEEELLSNKPNTKFCYRHQPDSKCRRQANEPSMAQLQSELATLSQSDQQAISHLWSLFSAAPSKHRNLMLQGILTQCCFPQLSYISAHVRDLVKIDFLAALPSELGFKILCYLDTTSLCKAGQVSQRWRTLADDDVVWHRMCEQHIDRKCTKCGWGLPLLERKRLMIEKREMQRRLHQGSRDSSPLPDGRQHPQVAHSDTEREGRSTSKRRVEEDVSSPESVKRQCSRSVQDNGILAEQSGESSLPMRKRPWKDVYKDRFKVGTNWKYGRASTKVFRGHTNGVMCLQFDDNVLITGSYDSTVKVWDVRTGQELRTLRGHTSGVRCLQFDDQKLMTGSLDNTIKLWNWRTGQLLRTFQAHNAGVLSLHFSGSWVASGSMDQTIRVWNSETQQTFLLRGHTDLINSVKLDASSRTLFSASDDLTVKLWDLDTHACIRVFEGHVGQVQQVVPLPAEFELDDNRKNSLHDKDKDDDASSTTSDPLSHSGVHHREPTPALEDPPFWHEDPSRPAPPRYILSGALDSTIRLWDVHFNPHRHNPTLLTTNNNALNSTTNPTNPMPSFQMLPTDPLTNSHTPRAQACLRTFFGHVEGIWALAADHMRLISGSEDRMMKVWDPRTGKCERTFAGHTGPVTCAWLSDRSVATGSEDCEVRMLCFG